MNATLRHLPVSTFSSAIAYMLPILLPGCGGASNAPPIYIALAGTAEAIVTNPHGQKSSAATCSVDATIALPTALSLNLGVPVHSICATALNPVPLTARPKALRPAIAQPAGWVPSTNKAYSNSNNIFGNYTLLPSSHRSVRTATTSHS